MHGDVPSLRVYRALAQRNPSPYLFHLDLAEGELLGSSPETFLRVDGGPDGCPDGRTVELRPIAGTAPRGFTADGAIDDDLDSRLAMQLLADDKERAEHAMLLDLARNDVARIARPGTTRVVQQLALERYSHVQHLVSRVRGALRPGLDALHAFRACANAGTLTGAPKPMAMALLRGLEPWARGCYGGAVGYLLQDGRCDTCIAIRSLRRRGGSYFARAGAGIVAHSDPGRELQETAHKLLAPRTALAMATAMTTAMATPMTTSAGEAR
jgi:anthranilate synthase component 1